MGQAPTERLWTQEDSMDQCPVCQTQAHIYSTGRSSGDSRIDCPRCGEFELRGTLVATLQKSLDAGIHRRALMSHNIRREERPDNKPPLISTHVCAPSRPGSSRRAFQPKPISCPQAANGCTRSSTTTSYLHRTIARPDRRDRWPYSRARRT